MYYEEIDIDETHIRLTTDVENHNLSRFVYYLRKELKDYMTRNSVFAVSLEKLEYDHNAPDIVKVMLKSSDYADVGPMACVAGSISELSLKYLMRKQSTYSIVENGGDIALINDKKILCGVYSNNYVLGNKIAFEIKPHKKMIGISTSSGKIGHSISFGDADSVTVVSKSPSVADGLATRIANEVVGSDCESKVNKAITCAEEYREFFEGVLIISEGYVGTVGRLPRIVETNEFNVKL